MRRGFALAGGAHADVTRFLAQLTFKGLSSVDNGLIAAFRSSVAGYTPLPPPPPPESRFINYE